MSMSSQHTDVDQVQLPSDLLDAHRDAVCVDHYSLNVAVSMKRTFHLAMLLTTLMNRKLRPEPLARVLFSKHSTAYNVWSGVHPQAKKISKM